MDLAIRFFDINNQGEGSRGRSVFRSKGTGNLTHFFITQGGGKGAICLPHSKHLFELDWNA